MFRSEQLILEVSINFVFLACISGAIIANQESSFWPLLVVTRIPVNVSQ